MQNEKWSCLGQLCRALLDQQRVPYRKAFLWANTFPNTLQTRVNPKDCINSKIQKYAIGCACLNTQGKHILSTSSYIIAPTASTYHMIQRLALITGGWKKCPTMELSSFLGGYPHNESTLGSVLSQTLPTSCLVSEYKLIQWVLENLFLAKLHLMRPLEVSAELILT